MRATDGEGGARPSARAGALQTLAVTGDDFFVSRHHALFAELARRVQNIVIVSDLSPQQRLEIASAEIMYAAGRLARRPFPLSAARLRSLRRRFRRHPATFKLVSRFRAAALKKLPTRPDLVFALFSRSSPDPDGDGLPYVYYLDFTAALSRRQWSAWEPFEDDATADGWFRLEGDSYRRARMIFAMSEAVRRSLISDYDVEPARIAVVLGSGNFDCVPPLRARHPTRCLIFNGSQFELKGGDRVLAAFARLRGRYPDARLIIVGTNQKISVPQVEVTGYIHDPKRMDELFAAADVVIAPARMEPFGCFIVEGMRWGAVPVLSDVGAARDIVEDGFSGLIVPDPTPEVIAERIAALFEDPTRTRAMSKAARDRVASHLTWSRVVDRMFAALGETAR